MTMKQMIENICEEFQYFEKLRKENKDWLDQSFRGVVNKQTNIFKRSPVSGKVTLKLPPKMKIANNKVQLIFRSSASRTERYQKRNKKLKISRRTPTEESTMYDDDCDSQGSSIAEFFFHILIIFVSFRKS